MTDLDGQDDFFLGEREKIIDPQMIKCQFENKCSYHFMSPILFLFSFIPYQNASRMKHSK